MCNISFMSPCFICAISFTFKVKVFGTADAAKPRRPLHWNPRQDVDTENKSVYFTAIQCNSAH